MLFFRKLENSLEVDQKGSQDLHEVVDIMHMPADLAADCPSHPFRIHLSNPLQQGSLKGSKGLADLHNSLQTMSPGRTVANEEIAALEGSIELSATASQLPLCRDLFVTYWNPSYVTNVSTPYLHRRGTFVLEDVGMPHPIVCKCWAKSQKWGCSCYHRAA